MKRNAAIALVAFLLGVYAHSTWSTIKRTATGSIRFDLENALKSKLKAYHDEHNQYPKSLDEIEVEWLKDPERRKELMRSFYYENRDDSFVLWWPRNFKE